MYEYSTINKTAEAAGPLADLEAVEVRGAREGWHSKGRYAALALPYHGTLEPRPGAALCRA